MSLDPEAGGLFSGAPPSALSFPLSFFGMIDFRDLEYHTRDTIVILLLSPPQTVQFSYLPVDFT